MSLFNKIQQKVFNEFINIIDWSDNTSDALTWRSPRYGEEMKNKTQLSVGKTQMSVFVSKEQHADVYQSGQYEIAANNMPVLTTLKGLESGINLPFVVDVYFVNAKQFLNKPCCTANTVLMRNSEFGPIRMRAYGSYSFHVDNNPIVVIRNIAGKSSGFSAKSVTDQLHNFVITKFTDYFAESEISSLDFEANLNEFSSELSNALKDGFSEYGVELTKFSVESISLPEVVEATLDKHTSVSVIGDMTTFTQMQFADSLKDAANNQTGDENYIVDAMDGQIAQQMVKPQDEQSPAGQLHNTASFNAKSTIFSGATIKNCVLRKTCLRHIRVDV